MFMLQSLWNPFRDWNIVSGYPSAGVAVLGFKASETLLGIETPWPVTGINSAVLGFKASETLLGIETYSLWWLRCRVWEGFKASETLLGIETEMEVKSRMRQAYYKLQSLWNPFRDWNDLLHASPVCKSYSSFKASETLLGIETQVDGEFGQINVASKPLKPF